MNKIHVGTWTVDYRGTTVTTFSEYAAHYMETKIEPGQYPVYAKKSSNYAYLSIEVSGVVVSSNPNRVGQTVKPHIQPYFYQLEAGDSIHGGSLSINFLSKQEEEDLKLFRKFGSSV